MNKNDYQKPALQTVNINMSHHLLQGTVRGVGGNGGVTFGGASSNASDQNARSRGGDWDDED